ncbi:hypothetical protein H7169_00340 [Candidatus Gracilibacteria bacterium]|nr:hypothetical protein [Candidatus Gracilibacteria bacterium]
MLYLVDKFTQLLQEKGLPYALARTIDFVGNRVASLIIASSNIPESPVDLSNKKVLLVESVGKMDGWGFGDGIFRLPIVEWLGMNSEVHMLSRGQRSPIFENNPNILKSFVIEDDRTLGSMVGLVKRLRMEGFDHIVAIHPTWKMHLLMYLTKTKTSTIHTSALSLDETRTTNIIHLFLSKAQRSLGHTVSDNIPSPKIYQNPSESDLKSRFENNKRYIGINIGAKSGLRHFRDWPKVFERLIQSGSIADDIVFVLVGKDGVNLVDKKIINLLGNKSVLNFCNDMTLAETYEIISYCNAGFVGMDGGNVNAAIAFRHITHARVIPIYNAVDPSLRVPSDIVTSDIVTIPCPDSTNCFSINMASHCTITNQSTHNNVLVPPCLQDANVITLVYESLISIMKKEPHSCE